MRRCFKVITLVVATLAALVPPLIFGVGTPFTPAAPRAWHQVHVGMQRSNILALVGSAQTNGYPEKIVETWYRHGALGLRKLEVWYKNYPDERVTTVREYVYWRSSRRCIHTRTEP